jgi:hypothetical protein
VQSLSPYLLQNPAAIIAEPNYRCDADDRGSSEISRELR